MKKLHFAVMAALILSGASVFAQTDSLSEPDASNIGNDSAKQALREVSVDRFEREGSWNVHISPDYGVISGRLFDGSPLAKEPLEDADNQIEDEYADRITINYYDEEGTLLSWSVKYIYWDPIQETYYSSDIGI